MFGINYSGGANKTHGQIEQTDRIDSFEVQSGIMYARHTGTVLPLDYSRSTLRGREFVRLSCRGWETTLELSHIPSGFGGTRSCWRCPNCGRRVRYLYFKGWGFLCRECAKLNYRSQQRTRDSINRYRDGLKLAREKLHWEPPEWTTPSDFPDLTPPRPRYMHEATYQRHLARFRQYQEAYQREAKQEMLTILRRIKKPRSTEPARPFGWIWNSQPYSTMKGAQGQ